MICKGDGAYGLIQQRSEVRVGLNFSTLRIVSLWKTVQQHALQCWGSEMGTSRLTVIVPLFFHFAVVLTYLFLGDFMGRIVTLITDVVWLVLSGYELTGLARGGEQLAKLKRNYAKAVELLVELASLQVGSRRDGFLQFDFYYLSAGDSVLESEHTALSTWNCFHDCMWNKPKMFWFLKWRVLRHRPYLYY